MKKYWGIFLLSFTILEINIINVHANLLQDVRDTYISGVVVAQSNEVHSECSKVCKVSALTLIGRDPVTLIPRKVQMTYYKALNQNRFGASVVIVPPIYGVNFLDRMNANGFCKRGLSAVIVESWENSSVPGINWTIHDQDTLRAISAIRNSIEFLSRNTGGPVGILGTSQGAIFSSLVAAIDPLVRASVLVAGGAPLSTILARSTIAEAVALKKDRMSKFSIQTEGDYETLLEESIAINGLTLASESDPKAILMFIGTEDKTVPTSAQIALWNAWSKPQKVNVPFDHIGTIGTAHLIYHTKIMEFFTQSLGGT